MLHQEEIRAVIGPLGSGSVWRYWNLLLGPDQVVGWPYTIGESWQLAFSMQLPFVPPPKEAAAYGPAELQDAASGRDLRVHLLTDITRIALQITAGWNRIVVYRKDGREERYTIWRRELTQEYSAALGAAYPGLYVQEGAPTTLWAKVLKW